MESVLRFVKAGQFSWPAVSLFMGGLLWMVSLTQVAFYTTEGAVMGFWVFATGWMGFALFQFAWYANLLELLGVLLMYRKPNLAMALVVAGVLLAGQAFWFEKIPNEHSYAAIVELGTGFWLWYGSIVLLTLGVIFDSGDREMQEEPGSGSPALPPANPEKQEKEN